MEFCQTTRTNFLLIQTKNTINLGLCGRVHDRVKSWHYWNQRLKFLGKREWTLFNNNNTPKLQLANKLTFFFVCLINSTNWFIFIHGALPNSIGVYVALDLNLKIYIYIFLITMINYVPKSASTDLYIHNIQ